MDKFINPIHAHKSGELPEPAYQIQVDELFPGGGIRFPVERDTGINKKYVLTNQGHERVKIFGC